MSKYETLYCENHPDRIALERCEVCHRPLCAYCLYYTEDGQRLCHKHAEEARLRGLRIEEPDAYAEQLIGAQAGATRKEKRGLAASDRELYKGNSNDLLAFAGLLVGLVSLGTCCGGGYCLPFGGFLLSLMALINAKKSYDPRRTRRLGVFGLLLSGVWVVIIAGCIFLYGLSLSSIVSNLSNPNFYVATISWSSGGSAPTATPSPTDTPTPGPEDETPGPTSTAETPGP